VLERSDRGFLAQPSHASLRLWEDSRVELLGPEVETAPALDYTSKARLIVGGGLGHCNEPRPLLAAYFLGDGGAADIEFRRLSGGQALVAWAKHSFLLDVNDQALIAAHFEGIASLAGAMPCYIFDYPRRYDKLNWVRENVLAHVSKLSQSG
jgi:hypothetical protein